MGRWEQRYWGHAGFPETLTALELQRFFTPTAEELPLVIQRRSEANRIAFALQLGYLKMTGRSLNSVDLVPPAILTHLGEVMGCAAPRIASGAFSRVDLLAWNFELNDWVRVDAYLAP